MQTLEAVVQPKRIIVSKSQINKKYSIDSIKKGRGAWAWMIMILPGFIVLRLSIIKKASNKCLKIILKSALYQLLQVLTS